MMLLSVPPARASTTVGNRLINPGAEDGLAGWQGTGFGLASYESDAIPRFPAPNFVAGPDWQLGERLFSAGGPGAIWQIADFADLAGSIDGGQQYLSWGGLLGGRGGQPGGARLVVQPLDATGGALGEPYVVGNPSDRDRQSRTALLPCRAETGTAPVGMRAALVMLEAVGHGLADDLHLTAVRLPAPASPPPVGFRTADGPGCATGERVVPQPPVPEQSGASPPTGGKFPAKLSLARARIDRSQGALDVLAPITARASGRVRVELHGAGRKFRFTQTIDSADGRIRFRKRIPKAQAALGHGIVTITYAGDADTRPQTVRLRAASQPARLQLQRPRIVDGRLRASGTVSHSARGVVRVQLQYDHLGVTRTLAYRVPITAGKWALNQALSAADRAAIAARTGTVHSYTLFTGYLPRHVRGEMSSHQVLPEP